MLDFLKPIDLLKPRTILAIRIRLATWFLFFLSTVYYWFTSSALVAYISKVFVPLKGVINGWIILALAVLISLLLLALMMFCIIESVSLLFNNIFSFLKPDPDSYNELTKKLKNEKEGVIFNYIQCVKNQKRELTYYEIEYISENIDGYLLSKSKKKTKHETRAESKKAKQEFEQKAKQELETEFLKIKEQIK